MLCVKWGVTGELWAKGRYDPFQICCFKRIHLAAVLKIDSRSLRIVEAIKIIQVVRWICLRCSVMVGFRIYFEGSKMCMSNKLKNIRLLQNFWLKQLEWRHCHSKLVSEAAEGWIRKQTQRPSYRGFIIFTAALGWLTRITPAIKTSRCV